MSDIKAFPMDSRVTEMGEDGLPVYDRQFGSSDLREVMKAYFGDGYFADEGTSMNVKASSGLDVTVQAGKVNMQGTLGYMDEDATVRLSNADKTYTRIDSIVARLDLSIDKRSIELYAKSGSASSSPTRPSLERTETVWELGLADVTLKAGVTEVTDADITDTRLDADRCGVAEPFAKLDTASLLEQVTAIVTQAQADVKADTDKLEKATGDAVSAMNDALSSTVLGSVWRLQSSSTSDYLTYGDDLNNIASVGTKFCDSASVAGGIANKPSDVTGPFSLATFATEQDPSRLGQVLMTCDASGVREYTRAGAGSSWTGWKTSAASDKFPVSTGDIADSAVTLAKLASGVGDAIRAGFTVRRFDMKDSTADNAGASFGPTMYDECAGYYVEELRMLALTKLEKVHPSSASWQGGKVSPEDPLLPDYVPRLSKDVVFTNFSLVWTDSNSFLTWTALHVKNGLIYPSSTVSSSQALTMVGTHIVFFD